MENFRCYNERTSYQVKSPNTDRENIDIRPSITEKTKYDVQSVFHHGSQRKTLPSFRKTRKPIGKPGNIDALVSNKKS
ncbi:hypothetical protein AYI68_g3274 [Smittium mucronatum]|uniref:Uncharacterized protein n=1 Tax=Smittium mucronatum TaxID=133383 RepID=A0A1R0H0D0_9FUNG|nr:hypothetical protein AYI68_g3274 [Smittium mucronatum]